MPRFFFAQDNDCHWYLVPAEHRAEWHAWCEIPDDDERSWEPPAFAKPIDSPFMMTFTDPQ